MLLNLLCFNTFKITCLGLLPRSSTPRTTYPVGLFHHQTLLHPPLLLTFLLEVSFLLLSSISYILSLIRRSHQQLSTTKLLRLNLFLREQFGLHAAITF